MKSSITRPTGGMPGVRCKQCISAAPHTYAGSKFPRITWVLPGKHCPKCGYPC